MIEYVISGFIAGLTVSISIYVLLKSSVLDMKIEQMFNDFISEMTENEELQKKLYTIGGIIGSGASSGLGLQKKNGKMGWTDLLMSFLPSFLNQTQAVVKNTVEEQLKL